MSARLTFAQSRIVAICLVLAVLGGLVAAIAAPTFWLHKRYDTYLEDYSDRLVRYRRVAALRPSIEDSIAHLKDLDSRKYYLKGATPTLASAELQGLVTQIIETHNGRIVSSQVQVAKDSTTGDSKKQTKEPAKLSISVQMNAAMVPLQLILHALESREPYLIVDQFTVRANQGRGYKPVAGVQPEFAVQMTVSGYTPADGDKP